MSKLVPCKYLDYTTEYRDCKLCTLAPHYPHVRFWERGPTWTDYPDAPKRVQFCGAGRGRINAVFDCYDGSMPCYEPAKETR